MNSWESSAFDYQLLEDGKKSATETSRLEPDSSATDRLIYPGLYCPSGFDMMSILVRVATRPNPQVELGAIDASCALIVCDLQQLDQPIVYASEPFHLLTGYDRSEVMGRNCRFLQAPGGKVKKSSTRKYVDNDTLGKILGAVEKNTELQIEIANFKKSGEKFVNLLTIIPVRWGSEDFTYSVGFQCEKED